MSSSSLDSPAMAKTALPEEEKSTSEVPNRFQISLPSGHSETVSVLPYSTVVDLQTAAQQSFGHHFLRLAAPDGRLLDPEDSLQASGLQDGDSLTAVAQQPRIAATRSAFALWYFWRKRNCHVGRSTRGR